MRSILLFIFSVFVSSVLLGQSPYNMTDDQVDDCEGFLLDSDDNPEEPGHYAHNELYVFTICPPNGDSIVFSFLDFSIEECCDFLSIFDGPDTNGILLGTFSGTTNPGTLIATSGCLTIKFQSDKDISDFGWIAEWETITKEPEAPEIIASDGASCFSNTLTITLDEPIPCDSVYNSLFTISGPSTVEVSNAVPLNCSNGTTDKIELTLDPSFSDNGMYNIQYRYRYTDPCGTTWEFDITATSEVSDCPLTAEILTSTDTICQGDCVELTGDASGGDAATYSYNWNQGLPSGKGPHTVCPVTTTTYELTVTDNSASPQDIATKTIVVVPRPEAGTNQTMCRFDAPITLSGTPAGGIWEGSGIADPVAGTFDPDSGIIGINEVWYVLNGCADTIEVEVLLSWAGSWEAACPGSDPFQVEGGFPAGGTWSGTGISSSGTFDPASAGTYTVAYTAPNGCQHSKNIYVDNISIPDSDTTCSSLTAYQLTATPPGGRWSGTGVTNTVYGTYNPSLAGSGSHTITYTLNGCTETTEIYVQEIDGGNNQVYCPLEGIVTLPAGSPAGGYWTGSGVVDSASGTYDPGWRNGLNFNDPVVYHFQGCTDTIMAYGRNTYINMDTLEFCATDDDLLLNWANVKRSPSNGQWSGPGITDPDFPGRFDPQVAGPGAHTLTYDANTCSATMTMIVHALPELQADTTVCNEASAFLLTADPAGGIWKGTGITDTNSGLFDPGNAGMGIKTITYTDINGCVDSMYAEVEPVQSISIDPIAPYFCFSDTSVALLATPADGNFYGPGISDTTFNPLAAGKGTHLIYYQYGSGECAVADSFEVEVGDPLNLTTNFTQDSICFGEVARIAATAGGGGGTNYQFDWSHGLGNEDSVIATPTVPTTYTVALSDGCTQPVSQQVYVHVYPEISTSYTSAPKVCHGIESFVAAKPANGGIYQFEWQTTPAVVGDTLHGPAGNYEVQVTDVSSGCSIIEQATIEGYDFLKAQFTINPSDDCTTILQPDISIIDQSVGGTTGTFSFGDGEEIPYIPGDFIEHTYRDTGTFRLQLKIENEGGCTDTAEMSFCVESAATLYVPTGFTPNGDGMNDQFKVRGIGIQKFKMIIFNRWGERLFETNDMEIGWDGLYQGKIAPNDAYTYLIIYEDMTSDRPKKKKGTFALIR